jgi:nucleotide-binding universal stress UspA family protein
MYNKVLVTLDGSKTAEVVLTYARELAGRLNLDLDLLHVCNPDDNEMLPMCQAYVDHVAEILKTQSENIRHSSGVSIEKKINIRGTVVMGKPEEEILKYADANNIDIIMLATHGRSKPVSSLGSTVDKVIHNAKVPIWLVPSEIRQEVIFDKLPKRTILVPLDGSKLAESIIPYIKELYKQRSAETEIVLINVGKSPKMAPLNWEESKGLHGEDTPPATIEGQLYLNDIAQQLEAVGLKTQVIAIFGNPEEEIFGFISQFPPQLIAMATYGRSGLKQLIFGSVAETLIRKVKTTPIFLIRPTE